VAIDDEQIAMLAVTLTDRSTQPHPVAQRSVWSPTMIRKSTQSNAHR
jgi:hypothetical protein